MSFRTRIASIGRLLRLQWAVSKSAFLLSMLATVLAGIAPPVEAYVLKKVIDVCPAQAGAGLVWTFSPCCRGCCSWPVPRWP